MFILTRKNVKFESLKEPLINNFGKIETKKDEMYGKK